MDDAVTLYYTRDPDTGDWLVWFPHPLGGMDVLATFDNETDAREYWQEQMDSADLSGE